MFVFIYYIISNKILISSRIDNKIKKRILVLKKTRILFFIL
uniref:Uncharacterized protein n=1 Tax=Melanothamnus harveyi TaxID=397005 RepID=A0A1Z1MHB7_MELHR|nr:hypothetical protein [Melanothamnus harveyi]ARW65467.1 hypothetical protein [Melanothamnus harveyi]